MIAERPKDATGYGIGYEELGNILCCQNQYKLAIDAFNKAIAINPYRGECYSKRGSAKLKQKAFNGAISDFRMQQSSDCSSDKSVVDALYRRSEAYCAQNSYGLAQCSDSVPLRRLCCAEVLAAAEKGGQKRVIRRSRQKIKKKSPLKLTSSTTLYCYVTSALIGRGGLMVTTKRQLSFYAETDVDLYLSLVGPGSKTAILNDAIRSRIITDASVDLNDGRRPQPFAALSEHEMAEVHSNLILEELSQKDVDDHVWEIVRETAPQLEAKHRTVSSFASGEVQRAIQDHKNPQPGRTRPGTESRFERLLHAQTSTRPRMTFTGRSRA